jgi:hypothetical protein
LTKLSGAVTGARPLFLDEPQRRSFWPTAALDPFGSFGGLRTQRPEHVVKALVDLRVGGPTVNSDNVHLQQLLAAVGITAAVHDPEWLAAWEAKSQRSSSARSGQPDGTPSRMRILDNVVEYRKSRSVEQGSILGSIKARMI